MIIDTSALVALVRNERDSEKFIAAIDQAQSVSMSAATLLECCIVVDAFGSSMASRRLDQLVRAVPIEIEPVTAEHVAIARDAYADFGRGSGHEARLNFGDCFSYAAAFAANEPLLFKGNDFNHTDLTAAVEPDDF